MLDGPSSEKQTVAILKFIFYVWRFNVNKYIYTVGETGASCNIGKSFDFEKYEFYKILNKPTKF